MSIHIENLSYKGSFFLPSQSNDTVVGMLSIDSEGIGQLDLLGAFESENLFSKRGQQTIFGTLFNGDKVTLLDSYRGQSVYRSAGSEVRYNVGTTVIGTHIQNRDEEVFTNISAEIDYLQEWLGIDGGQLEFSLDFKNATYKYEQPDDIVFEIENGLSGTIYFRNEFWDGKGFGNEFHQRVRLDLETKKKRSINQLLKSLLSFRQLISIFIGQQVNIKQIVLISPDEQIELINPTPGRKLPLTNIFIYFKSGQRYVPLPDNPIVFVRYESIDNSFPEIVRNWYQLLETELRPVVFILLDALTDHSKFEEADFLRAWNGVEAFHRLILQDTIALKEDFNLKMQNVSDALSHDAILNKWVKQAMSFSYEPPAKKRIYDLIHQYKHLLPDVVIDETIVRWAKEMGNTRNYLTHFDPAGKKKKVSGKKLYQYTKLLNWLLLVLILKHLKVDEDLLKNLSDHQHLYLSSLIREQNTNN